MKRYLCLSGAHPVKGRCSHANWWCSTRARISGVPMRIRCDNLKTGVVSHPREGEIILNDQYVNFAEHYGCAILPAGVRKPKHKASVEGNVGNIATSIIARLRVSVKPSAYRK